MVQGVVRRPGSRVFFINNRTPGDDGVALVVVLGWLALLALIATQITSSGHTEVLIARNIRGAAIAEAAADGAVNQAIFQMLAHIWGADRVVHVIHGPQAIAEVWTEDEGDRVDPNVAPLILMQMLLRKCGATPQAAAQIAAAIVDWRSLDVLQSTDGKMASLYRSAGLGYVPPHKRFVSKDELGLVLGMTPGLLSCLGPHVTVYSLAVPSLQSTDPVVRQALVDAYPDDVMRPASAVVHDVAVVRITAIAHEAGGSRFRRVAVVRVAPATPDDHFIYKVLSWETAED